MFVSAPPGGFEKIPLMEIKGTETQVLDNKSSDSFRGVVDLVSKGVSSVNNMQMDAKNAVNKLVTGEGTNLHDVVLVTQQASLAFQFAVQVRNKAVEAYQEIMRMQV